MVSQEQSAFGNEVRSGLDPDALPAYAPMLSAFHRACAGPLQALVNDLPLQLGARVLDMACGDGVYSVWLAERVGSSGQVVGVDIAPAYLEVAGRHANTTPFAANIELQIGDITGLPFADDEFDLAWCAHSLYSLPDPITALRELRRVVRPGGTVAILENDTLHHMLLPWPAELELAVRQAQLDALRESSRATGKFYIGRNLCGAFKMAELHTCHVRTRTIDHHAPLSDDERLYLDSYLRDVAERSGPYLEAEARASFDMLLDPQSLLYLLDQPDFFASQLEIVAWGMK